MKSLLLLIVTFASFQSLAGHSFVDTLKGELSNVIKAELIESDGELDYLYCVENPKEGGVLCTAAITLIDTVAHGASQGGGEENCLEVYGYKGGDTYTTVCSTCAYAESYDEIPHCLK